MKKQFIGTILLTQKNQFPENFYKTEENENHNKAHEVNKTGKMNTITLHCSTKPQGINKNK